MKAVVTEGFLESIPDEIRKKFHLQVGMILNFDEDTPYLKATPEEKEDESAQEFESWLTESVGIAQDKFTTDELMHETRGED